MNPDVGITFLVDAALEVVRKTTLIQIKALIQQRCYEIIL